MSSYSDYAAKACALEKSALITLLAFNLFCSLITENSARTRNLFSPNILSNPKRPREYCKCAIRTIIILSKFFFKSFYYKNVIFHSKLLKNSKKKPTIEVRKTTGKDKAHGHECITSKIFEFNSTQEQC